MQAPILGGLGLQATSATFLALNMAPLCGSTWEKHAARVGTAAKAKGHLSSPRRACALACERSRRLEGPGVCAAGAL